MERTRAEILLSSSFKAAENNFMNVKLRHRENHACCSIAGGKENRSNHFSFCSQPYRVESKPGSQHGCMIVSGS
jgi:hypothetical protein